MMTPTEIITVIVFSIGGFYALQMITWGVRRLLKIDNAEREQILQAQIDELVKKTKDHDDLTRKVKEQEIDIEDLRKQIKLLVLQYEDAISRLAILQDQHIQVVTNNNNLKNQLKNNVQIKDRRPQRILMVMIGSDDTGLSLDLASIRAVRTETGLEIREISGSNPGDLKRELDEAKERGDHIYVHLAIRADKDGYQLGTSVVDATWLSSILDGVLVLVVAGTDSDYVGEFLGVVPYVITMSGSIVHRDAAIFSRSFWVEIGKGIGPSLALKRALAKSPSSIQKQIVSHWDTE